MEKNPCSNGVVAKSSDNELVGSHLGTGSNPERVFKRPNC